MEAAAVRRQAARGHGLARGPAELKVSPVAREVAAGSAPPLVCSSGGGQGGASPW